MGRTAMIETNCNGNYGGFCRVVKRSMSIFLCFVTSVLLLGCETPSDSNVTFEPEAKTKRIIAVSYALQYMTGRISGDGYSVELPASETRAPQAWAPSVEQIRDMQKADLIITNGPGADFAQWLVRVTLPKSKICNSCEGFELGQYIAVKDYRIVHSHGPEGEHSHPYFVPYPWLDPEIAILQAANIRVALSATYPESADRFKVKFAELKSELENLAKEFRNAAGSGEPFNVVSANPQMKYLTRFLGANDRHLFWFELPTFSDGNAGDVKTEFESRTDGHAADLFLLGEAPSDDFNEYLNEHGFTPVQVELLGSKPASGDYISALRQNFQTLLDAIK